METMFLKMHLRFSVFVLFLWLGTLFSSVSAKKGTQSKYDRNWKNNKTNCEKTTCKKIVLEESYNCVNRCTSQMCFDEIYADNPLEDGELDYIRNRAFVACLRKEQQAIAKAALK
jgi:hypothetical protein